MDEERTRLQKILLVLLAAMIVLFAILTGVSRAHKGVLFQESLLQKSESGGQTTYAGAERRARHHRREAGGGRHHHSGIHQRYGP